MATSRSTIAWLNLISALRLEKQEDKEVSTREDYEVIFRPNELVATATFHEFAFVFPAPKKRYLRVIEVRCNNRVVDVEAYLNKDPAANNRQGVHLMATPTHNMPSVTVEATIAIWQGDTPLEGHLLVTINNCEIGDTLRSNIIYEEKI